MHRVDGSNPGPGGSFVEGDAQAGTPRTQITGAWLTAIQEEIARVIEAAGIALSKPDNTQLYAALDAIARPSRFYRNILHNGNFAIFQRGYTKTFSVGTSGFAADRWRSASGSGGAAAATVQQINLGVAEIVKTGGVFGLAHNQSAQSGSGTPPYIEQRLDDRSLMGGQTLCLSFWARALSISSGTTVAITPVFTQHFGTAGSADVVTTGATLLVDGTSGGALYFDSVDIPSISGKTFGTGESYFSVRLNFEGLKTYNLEIYSVQLEQGGEPSAHEQRPESIERAICERYFFTTYPLTGSGLNDNVAPGTVTDEGSVKTNQALTEGRTLDTRLRTGMRLRKTGAPGYPIITWYSPATGAADNVRWEGADRAVLSTDAETNNSSGYPVVSASRALSALEAHFTADAEL